MVWAVAIGGGWAEDTTGAASSAGRGEAACACAAPPPAPHNENLCIVAPDVLDLPMAFASSRRSCRIRSLAAARSSSSTPMLNRDGAVVTGSGGASRTTTGVSTSTNRSDHPGSFPLCFPLNVLFNAWPNCLERSNVTSDVIDPAPEDGPSGCWSCEADDTLLLVDPPPVGADPSPALVRTASAASDASESLVATRAPPPATPPPPLPPPPFPAPPPARPPTPLPAALSPVRVLVFARSGLPRPLDLLVGLRLATPALPSDALDGAVAIFMVDRLSRLLSLLGGGRFGTAAMGEEEEDGASAGAGSTQASSSPVPLEVLFVARL